MSSSCQSQPQNSAPPLPTPEEAVRHSLQAYFEATVDKVALYLGQGQRKQYKLLTNQEIFHRGFFLHYIYEGLTALQQISHHWQSANSQPFKTFLTGLFFTAHDFTNLTRINFSCVFENESLPLASKRILELLYETEFYAYQILLRVVLVKLVLEEQERMAQEIEALNQRCIFPEYFTQEPRQLATKRDKSRLKQVFSEVEFILSCYHCELSIHRQQCVSRPEANCLLHLLKLKLSKSVLDFVRENIKFKCEGDLPVSIKIEHKNVQIIKPPIQSNAINASKPPQQPPEAQSPVNFKSPPQPKSPDMPEIKQLPKLEYVHFEVPSSPVRPLSKFFNVPIRKKDQIQEQKLNRNGPTQQKQFPPQLLQTPKKERNMKQSSTRNLEQCRRDSESGKSSDLVESNLPEFRYDRHLHPGTPSEKPKRSSKQVSLKEQIKAPQHLKRFANTQCNLRYTVAKHKRPRRREEERVLGSRLQTANPPPPAPANYFKPQKKQEESEESYLAQETPVYRNRTCLQSDNPH